MKLLQFPKQVEQCFVPECRNPVIAFVLLSALFKDLPEGFRLGGDRTLCANCTYEWLIKPCLNFSALPTTSPTS